MSEDLRKDKLIKKAMNRRTFIGGSALAAAAAMVGLSGCGNPSAASAPTEEGASKAASGAAEGAKKSAKTTKVGLGGTPKDGLPSFLSKPDPIKDSEIVDTKEAQIVIVGAGLSGICAARAAIDAGAESVLVIEKGEGIQLRSNQVGTVDSKIQRDLGIKIDKTDLVNEIMRECGYRPNARLLKYWADNSGAAFDWFLEPVEGKYVVESADTPTFDKDGISVRQMHYPQPKEADIDNNFYKIFPTCQIVHPTLYRVAKPAYEALDAKDNVEFIFSQRVVEIVRPDNKGRVEGVIARDLDGKHHKYTATKAVILATGDYSGNPEMMDYYVPWASHFKTIFPNVDAKGNKTNTGDGQVLGQWIGAQMELGPHAPMTHHLGGPLGVDGFLQVDIDGERFMNEDVGGQPVQNQLSRVKKGVSWQIFDDNFREQLPYMDGGHGNVSYFVSNDQVPEGEYGRNTYVSQEMFDEEITVVANSIEELAEKAGLPVDQLKATIERYNELAKKGDDEDFGKRASRMFPIEKAPFYGYKFEDTVILVTLGGLVTDEGGRVLDSESEIIEGLYATGNTMGGRFLVDYPLPAPGISHGMAITFGRMVGDNAVKL